MFIGISPNTLSNATGGGFSPKDISGLQIWFKGDAGVLDGSGNPITVNNTRVGTWKDQSGNGYDATQATDASRPFYRTAPNGQNNLPGVYFDGTNRWLAKAQQLFSTAVSLFIVIKYDDASGRYWPIDLAGNYPYHFAIDPNTGGAPAGRIGFFAGESNYYATSNNVNTAQIVSVLSSTVSGQSVLSNITFRQNKTTRTLTRQVGSGNWPDYSNVLAKGFSIGRPNNLAALQMKGQIFEIIVYNKVLTTQERDAIEGYLGFKWNIV